MPVTMAIWLTETRAPRMPGRSDLRDVERRDDRGRADGQAADEAEDEELVKALGNGAADGRDEKQDGRNEKEALPAESGR